MHKYNLMNKINELPDLIRTKDLIKLGVFSSQVHATACRKQGNSPTYIQLSKKRLAYPKEAVIEWLEKRMMCSQGQE